MDPQITRDKLETSLIFIYIYHGKTKFVIVVNFFLLKYIFKYVLKLIWFSTLKLFKNIKKIIKII
jgi:hypothetical protein